MQKDIPMMVPFADFFIGSPEPDEEKPVSELTRNPRRVGFRRGKHTFRRYTFESAPFGENLGEESFVWAFRSIEHFEALR